MDTNPNDNASAGGAPASQMTWQQQMMSQSWNQAPRKKKEKSVKAEASSKKKDNPKLPATEKPGVQMTWQQELFQQSKRVGPVFDHAADAKDVQTFGGDCAPSSKTASSGAASTPERRKNNKAKGSTKNRDARAPNTPQKQANAPVAYAGPTFHNSPSAASLPTPKFASRTKSPLSEPASAGPSAAMTPPRDTAVPSPPQLQTVDSLLAQMLKSSSVS